MCVKIGNVPNCVAAGVGLGSVTCPELAPALSFGEGWLHCSKGGSVSPPKVNPAALKSAIVKPVKPQVVTIEMPNFKLPEAPAAPTYSAPGRPALPAPATQYHDQIMDARWRALRSKKRAGFLQSVFAGEGGAA